MATLWASPKARNIESRVNLITTGTPWVVASLSSGWIQNSIDGTCDNLEYRVEPGGIVRFRGTVHANAAPGGSILTVPAAYRPSTNIRRPMCHASAGAVAVNFIGISSSTGTFSPFTLTASDDYHIDFHYRLF
ncbi:MAG TPA: hypothetical protein VGI66_03580 [Streptosporangiaceae bacterium]|jgi:hypothetical protein